MGKITYNISYMTYPSSREASSYSADRAKTMFFLWFVVFIASIVVIIFYIGGVVGLFGELKYINYFKTLLSVMIMSAVVLYCLIIYPELTDRKCRLIVLRVEAARNNQKVSQEQIDDIRSRSRKNIIELIKDYYGGFLLLLIAATGLIGCIKCIYMMSNNTGEPIRLFIALALLVAGVVPFCVFYLPTIIAVNRFGRNK